MESVLTGESSRRHQHRRSSRCVTVALTVLGLSSGACTQLLPPYFVPDNGTGTANMPPLNNTIASGPINATLAGNAIGPSGALTLVSAALLNLQFQPALGGGLFGLAGFRQQSVAQVQITLGGTGSLAGYHRTLSLAIQCEVHSGPHPLGATVQDFPTQVNRLSGQITGDPDFDLLRITAGQSAALPSPGHTTLTRQPDGRWAVDSFFDISYRIDFVGHPGGPITGMSGSQTTTQRIQIGGPSPQAQPPIQPGLDLWTTKGPSSLEFLEGSPNPSIPLGFFGPGSEPFSGVIELRGIPVDLGLGNTDTIIRRLQPVNLPNSGSTGTAPFELLPLHLTSVSPLEIQHDAGTSFFDVFVDLDPLGLANTMNVTRLSGSGGTLTFGNMSYLMSVYFVNEDTGERVEFILRRPVSLASLAASDWSSNAPAGTPPGGGPGFYPTTPNTLFGWGLRHTIAPPTNIPSHANYAAVYDINQDGFVDGADIQWAVNAYFAGPGNPMFPLVDGNANGIADLADIRLFVDILAAAQAAPTWKPVPNTRCDFDRHIILPCSDKDRPKGKVLIRAADVNEDASACRVKFQYRDCDGVDIGDPVEMEQGATKRTAMPKKDEQLVVWCISGATDCKISVAVDAN